MEVAPIVPQGPRASVGAALPILARVWVVQKCPPLHLFACHVETMVHGPSQGFAVFAGPAMPSVYSDIPFVSNGRGQPMEERHSKMLWYQIHRSA